MPRKTKETENPKESIAKNVSKKLKKTISKKSISPKNELNNEKKTAKKTKKESSSKIEKGEKKPSKTTSNKKNPAAKTKTLSKTKTISKKSTKSNKIDYDSLVKKDFSAEYYDLPFRYNQTVVKILAQTPSKLFIYWDISDSDRENLKKSFGEYFFQITKPVLIIHNKTMNYSFEVDIDDFANSWYLTIQDSNCDYQIELGRRPIPINYSYMPEYNVEKNGPIEPISDSYIYISSSNDIESPNDKILFNNSNKIYFRDVKTNKIIEKDIKDFPFINRDNEFISIYQIYKDLFGDALSGEDFRYLDLTNPSSVGNPSSGVFSSK